jgi:predicted dehydrogenase
VPQLYKLKQYEHFVALLDGTADDSLPTVVDGYRNQQVIEAIVQSSKEKLVIQLG